jgi:hypothetical protein
MLRPYIYQDIDGARRAVEGRYVKKAEERIGFAIGPYDTDRALVIDPANGTPCTFTLDVSDNGEHGATDAFSISVFRWCHGGRDASQRQYTDPLTRLKERHGGRPLCPCRDRKRAII